MRSSDARRGPKKAVLEKRAAEKIQHSWIKNRAVIQQRKLERAKMTQACIRIQARYRTHYIIKKKRVLAATTIQRFARGFLVRWRRKRTVAATRMQAFAVGMMVRTKLKLKKLAAISIQTRLRGMKDRKTVLQMRGEYERASLATQRAFRGHKGRQDAKQKKEEKMQSEAEQASAVAVQRLFRGKTVRIDVEQKRAEKRENDRLKSGATRIQSMFRRLVAYRRVVSMKKDNLDKRYRAATRIRGLIKGFLARQIFLRKLEDLRAFPSHVIVMQRYARGYLVRKHMFEQARRAEAEHGATVLVQRMYRGYRGRLEWEAKYEETWSREIAALRLQRAFRGFRARRKIYGLRKKYIRAEFAVAKRVFRAAQIIQARVRAVQSRGKTVEKKANVTGAALTIQRIYRGHCVRLRLWEAVLDERATTIQAHTRGMLARMRLAQVGYHVRVIQRRGRAYLAGKSASAAKAAA